MSWQPVQQHVVLNQVILKGASKTNLASGATGVGVDTKPSGKKLSAYFLSSCPAVRALYHLPYSATYSAGHDHV